MVNVVAAPVMIAPVAGSAGRMMSALSVRTMVIATLTKNAESRVFAKMAAPATMTVVPIKSVATGSVAPKITFAPAIVAVRAMTAHPMRSALAMVNACQRAPPPLLPLTSPVPRSTRVATRTARILASK